MQEFLFESIISKKVNSIKINKKIPFRAVKDLGNMASLHLNKQNGFFIYLSIGTLKNNHIDEFNKNEPEFKIYIRGDKSYMLISFSPNLPIFEFLFDVSIYKNHVNKEELEKILENDFRVALVDSENEIKGIKLLKINPSLFYKFKESIVKSFDNKNFEREYRVFLLPFYEKSTDRWWSIIE